MAAFFLNFFSFFVGCWATWTLSNTYEISAVAASAGIGLLGSFGPKVKRFSGFEISLAVYCGSFAGMCSMQTLSKIHELLIVSFLGAILIQLLQNKFTGLGGKLGMTAFLSVALFVLARGFA